jgi:hypothetical protein
MALMNVTDDIKRAGKHEACGRIENFSFYNDAMTWEKSVLFVAMHAIDLGLLSIERKIC